MISSCTDDWRRTNTSESWKSSDPLTIPYNIRMKEYKSGNLVPNATFNEGTPLSSDTSTVQGIKKWEMLGNDIRYTEAIADSIDKNDRNRFVMIHREYPNETDSLGEGILSDFIPVIPGNYELSLKIKAHNIRSKFHRFGSKLLDAINIRLLFYNNRREAISPSKLDPESGTMIDNGLKSAAFAGLNSIDELPWINLITHTGIAPAFDGDIPDDCRYVRIFIGLNGSGTIWIDDVQLTYSKWNFTSKERISWYSDSVFSKTALLIPTPRQITPKENITLISAGSESILYPVVVLDQPETVLNLYTRDYLAENLKRTLTSSYPECMITTHNSLGQLNKDASVIFLLTSYQTIDTLRFAINAPGFSSHEQGYVITDSTIHNKQVIILAGKDDLGLFYAATSVVRLLDSVSSMYQHAEIIDFPAYHTRGFSFSNCENKNTTDQDINDLDFLTLYRFNKAYIPLHFNSDPDDDLQKDLIGEYRAKQISQYSKQKGTINFGVMMNMMSPAVKTEHTTSRHDSVQVGMQFNEETIQKLTTKLKPYFDYGARFLMLLFKDFHPSYRTTHGTSILMNPEDQKRYTNLQNAHVFIIKTIQEWLAKNYNIQSVELKPLWDNLSAATSSDLGAAEAYTHEIIKLLPENISIIREFQNRTLSMLNPELIQRQTQYMDHYVNSVLYFGLFSNYPEKIKLLSIFEPYLSDKDQNHGIVSGDYVTSLIPDSEISRIQFATLADFLWNPEVYVPDLSLWKVLNSMFGMDYALQLIEFNDLYVKVYSNIIKMERAEKDAKSLKKNTAFAIRKLFLQIEVMLENESETNNQLIEELETLCLDLKDRLDKLEIGDSEIKNIDLNTVEE